MPPPRMANGVQGVIVTPPATTDDRAVHLPLLLTNARRTRELPALERALGRNLSQFVSQAYLRALFEAGIARCDLRDATTAEEFRTVLLNAFLANPCCSGSNHLPNLCSTQSLST